MADLLVSGGDTERPWQRNQPEHDDVPNGPLDGPVGDALNRAPGTPSEGDGTGSADVPDWVVEQVDRVSYPTRMARRRAIQAARVDDAWQPDPWVTTPVLNQVEDELSRVPGRRYEPTVLQLADPEPEEPAEASALADIPAQSTGPGRAERGTTSRPDLLPSVARSQRGARRRNHRRRNAAVAGGVVAALAATVALVVTQSGGDSGRQATAAAAAPTQQVVALGLSAKGQLTGVSLLASGSGGAQQVLVPSRLLLDVPGAGRLPVSRSLAPGGSAPGAAVADALDIRVAGTWVLSSSALATLVDSVGGVSVDVDVDVPQGAGEGAAIMVAAGKGLKLTGTQAAAYAQLLLEDEPEAVRLARQERVVTAVLAALPQDASQRRAFLVALPGAPKGAVLNAVLSITGALHDPAAQSNLPSTVLPVRDIDTGGEITAYGLDDAAAHELVAARLAGAAVPIPAGGRLSVLVQNGVGTPGLGDSARSRLVAAGLKYMGGGNVDGFGVKQSVVLLPDGSSQSRAKGLSVARALGLNESALRISETAPSVADLVVVLGQDFGGA